MCYTAVIRTDNCTPLLERVVAALRAQTIPPREIIFVDSSREESIHKALLNLGGRVVIYPDESFNFSIAINIGAQVVETPWLMLISSHVVLSDPELVARGLSSIRLFSCNAAYWSPPLPGFTGKIAIESVITDRDFNGYNALSNSCSLLPAHVVRDRPFRPEVFSAEDQEWGGWWMKEHGARILKIEHSGVDYLNANINICKYINEEISIAYFAYRRNLWVDRILARLGRGFLAGLRGRSERSKMHFQIAKGLFFAWFRQPRRQSKYY